MKQSERLNHRQPADWVAAWRHAADKAGVSLSEWIGNACNQQLPDSQQKRLSERRGPGQPAKS